MKTELIDTPFPQLADIVAPGQLAAALQNHLGAEFASGEVQVESCYVHRLYYKPGGGCRFHVKAEIRPQTAVHPSEQIFFGHLLPPHELEAQLVHAQEAEWTAPPFGSPITHIPEWDLLLWAYPNDPNLIGLPLLTAPERVLAQAQAQPERFGLAAHERPFAIHATLAKYVPGKRCSYLYDLQLPDRTHQLYAKAYESEAGPHAYTIWQQAWQSPACQRGPLRLPQPYSYDAKRHILWQARVNGRPLSKMADGANLPTIATNAAHQLAAFHSQSLDLPSKITIIDELDNLARSVKAISKAHPQIAQRCRTLHQQLLHTAAAFEPVTLTPIHASFKFSHILTTGNDVTLIDFDGAYLGDPAYDLGRFVAYVWGMAADGKIDRPLAQQTIHSFTTTYQQAATLPVPTTRLNWFTASLLLNSHLYKTVKRIRVPLLDQLLALAEQLCPPTP